MIESRRKILTVVLGEKWHDYKLSQGRGISTCSCGNKGMSVWDICTKANRTFTKPDDYEALQEKVINKNGPEFILFGYKQWVEPVWVDDFDNMICYMDWFLGCSVEERCELICDFVKANPHLFPKVVEYLASLVTIRPPINADCKRQEDAVGGEGMTTEEMFKKELSELLRKYDCALSAEDHWQGYAECGEDVRMTVEFNDYRLSDVDLGRYFDGGDKT